MGESVSVLNSQVVRSPTKKQPRRLTVRVAQGHWVQPKDSIALARENRITEPTAPPKATSSSRFLKAPGSCMF